MDRGIPLHPKYGVNPTISLCFYCGEPKNEIALLGAKYRNEAPMHMVTSIEPCDECKSKYAEYTLLVEVNARENYVYGQRMRKDPQPTGRWAAIRKECLHVENPGPIAYVEPQTMNHLLAQMQKVEAAT